MAESTLASPRILTSQVLEGAGFSHGFSLRSSGDPVASLTGALGFSPELLYQVNQVHGARVVQARGDRDAMRAQEADALIAIPPNAVGVRVADCVPLLVGDRGSGVVAAIHAGWRGIVAGVIHAALRGMPSRPAAKNVAAIGPCIGPCCFEVGADVATQIVDACGEPRAIARRSDDGVKAYVDLRVAVRALLVADGLADADVDDVAGCTRCDAVRFFSYRRDGANAGRQLAVIRARMKRMNQRKITLDHR